MVLDELLSSYDGWEFYFWLIEVSLYKPALFAYPVSRKGEYDVKII